MYYLVYKDIEIGGVETLILRESKWILENTSENCCVICNSISNQMKSSFDLNSIKYIVIKKWKPAEIDKIFKINNDITLIKYFSFLDYLHFIISPYCKGRKCVYYCVHPHHSFIFKNDFGYRKRAKIAVSALMVYLLNENKIRFMDEETLFSTLDYFSISRNDEYKANIDRLPYDIKKIEPNKKNLSRFNILTVSRAEFPFKGYLLGLTDELEEIVKEYPEVYLTIISGGQHMDILKDKIESLDNLTKDHIALFNFMSPEELEDYYSSADLFIGMGTTVLDAANHSVPSVIAKPDTTKMLTNGYFHTNPKDIGLFTSKDISASKYIKDVINMSDEEYVRIQNNSREALYNYYDANKIIKNNLNLEVKNIENNFKNIDFSAIRFFLLLKSLKNILKKGE